MIVTYHSKFKKDLQNLKDNTLKTALLNKIKELKEIASLEQISNLRKLSGHPDAYRLRIGNYRLGLFLEDKHTLRLQRFVKRNDISKLFP